MIFPVYLLFFRTGRVCTRGWIFFKDPCYFLSTTVFFQVPRRLYKSLYDFKRSYVIFECPTWFFSTSRISRCVFKAFFMKNQFLWRFLWKISVSMIFGRPLWFLRCHRDFIRVCIIYECPLWFLKGEYDFWRTILIFLHRSTSNQRWFFFKVHFWF